MFEMCIFNIYSRDSWKCNRLKIKESGSIRSDLDQMSTVSKFESKFITFEDLITFEDFITLEDLTTFEDLITFEDFITFEDLINFEDLSPLSMALSF